MEQYEVGQILYTTSKNSFKIIPIQVVEEVVRTTINGTEKTYMVCFPDLNKTTVDIKKIKGEEAEVIKGEAFGIVKPKIEENVQQNETGDIIKVDLGNGQVGRINKSQIKNPGE